MQTQPAIFSVHMLGYQAYCKSKYIWFQLCLDLKHSSHFIGSIQASSRNFIKTLEQKQNQMFYFCSCSWCQPLIASSDITVCLKLFFLPLYNSFTKLQSNTKTFTFIYVISILLFHSFSSFCHRDCWKLFKFRMESKNNLSQ